MPLSPEARERKRKRDRERVAMRRSQMTAEERAAARRGYDAAYRARRRGEAA